MGRVRIQRVAVLLLLGGVRNLNAPRRLKLRVPVLKECGVRLAGFFERCGVIDGGSGLHLGTTIDHVLAAISKGRTKAGVGQPLMALLEVASRAVGALQRRVVDD